MKVLNKLIKFDKKSKEYIVFIGKGYDTYDFEYCHERRLQEIIEHFGSDNVFIFKAKDRFFIESKLILESKEK
ncbi:MAG: hypothetical protein J6T23_02550 [Elusimicrobia bacterium]|nr:hypothetical protein [Elusimicrobiota bacterium]